MGSRLEDRLLKADLLREKSKKSQRPKSQEAFNKQEIRRG